MIRHLRSGLFSLCLLLLLLAGRGQATDRNWIDTSGGLNNWNDATNWSPSDDFAKAGDNAFFDQDATYTAIVQSPSAADNVTFSNGNVTLGGGTLNISGVTTIDDVVAAGLNDGAIVTASGLTWDTAGNAIVGNSGFGTFTVDSAGSVRAINVIIGDNVGAVGEVNVTGVGSTLTTDGPNSGDGYLIGNSGTGTLNVTGGGLAQILNDTSGGIADFQLGVTADGEGTLNIDGATSSVIAEDLFVGNSGTGHLSITAGGLLNQNIAASPDAFIAQQTGSSGDATVNGDGSQWFMARLEVGNLGDATLSVEAGALVRSNSNDMTVADAGGSGRVAVFGAGTDNSTLDVTNDLYVGNIGLGELFVGQDLNGTADGNGTLDVGNNLLIGTGPGTTEDNKVIVSGANAVVMIGASLQAGRDGTGTFEAHDGATVMVGGAVASGGLPGGNGTIVLDGPGTTLTANSLFVGNGNSGPTSTGVVTVSDQAVATFGSNVNGVVTIGDDPNSEGTLTVTGAGSRVETTGGTAEWWIGGSSNDTGGTGTLNVLDGGEAVSTGRVILGYAGTASGTLNVADPGSLFDANGDRISIGFNGIGEANITNGGLVEANTFRVADEPGSTGSSATISGVDLGGDGQPGGGDDTPSRVEVSGVTSVGEAAQGSLLVSAGGQLESNIGVTVFNTNVAVIGGTSATDNSIATVTGDGSSWVQNGWLRVGASGGSPGAEVALNVLDGGYVEATFVEMAQLDGSASKVNVDGVGSVLRLIDGRPGGGTSPGFGDIRMVPTGSNGKAEISVTGGGTIDLDTNLEIGHGDASGSASVSVSGPGSRIDAGMDISVSFTGTPGTLTLEDGGEVQNLNEAFIGRGTALGTATIGAPAGSDDGDAPTSWTVGPSGGSSALYIAGDSSGNGLGGTANAVTGILNINPTGTVTVDGLVRVWDRGVINLDGGTLELEDIDLTDSSGTIPNNPTFNFNTGTLRFTDAAGYTLDAAKLDGVLGNNPTLVADQHLAVTGTAVLTAPLRLNGGALSVGAITAASLSNLDFDAGTFSLTGSPLTVGPSGQFGSAIVLDSDETINVVDHAATVNGFASLNIIGGGYTSAATTNDPDGLIIVSNTTSVDFDSDTSGSGLTNNGDLIAIDSTISGSVVNNGGIEIVGAVNFSDDVSLLAGGSLGIDLNGPSNFDSISVGGDAFLGGALDVNVAGFSLTAGNSFKILDVAGTTSGTFAGLADGGLVGNFGGVDLFINYDGGDGNDVVLFTAGAALPGDGNGDGMVDGLDYLIWAENFGDNPANDPPGSPGNGDFNDDGVVDGLDYLVWAGSFGSHAAAAVPEPNTIVLAIAGLSAWVLRRRRR